MLTCDLCYALIFPNASASQQLLLDLPEYQDNYLILQIFNINYHSTILKGI